ncbi:hypothetical protein NL676_029888 [Syzygium grande]|nr:hypothetical protein NL676_029888 [Syzygium grande]
MTGFLNIRSERVLQPPARDSPVLRLELNSGEEAVRHSVRDPSAGHLLSRSDANSSKAPVAGLSGNAADLLLDTNPRGVNLSPLDLNLDSEQGLISSDRHVSVDANAGQAVVPGNESTPPVMLSNTEHELLCPQQNFLLVSNAGLVPPAVMGTQGCPDQQGD